MRSRKRVPVSRVSGRVLNIGQRGASEETWGAQAPPRRGQEGGRATRAPGALVAPLRISFGCLEASGTLIFYIIFPAVFVMGKPEIQKQQKTETGTGVH